LIGFGVAFALKSPTIRDEFVPLKTTLQAAVVAIKKSELYSSLWAGCDELFALPAKALGTARDHWHSLFRKRRGVVVETTEPISTNPKQATEVSA
jgi:hypothetical protein